MTDLFLTVVDSLNGKTYYEIFLRREKEVPTSQNDEDSANSTLGTDGMLKGLNSFCLVQREEVPA